MGGCASKPKGMDLHPTSEVPATPSNNPEAETISLGNNNGGESAAAPLALVDRSESNEPKQQEAGGDAVAPSKPAEPEPEPAGVPDCKSTTADLTQAEKVEAIAKESEDKTTTEATTVHTQSKEAHPKTHADTINKSDATPTASEDKSVAPLVAV